MTEDTRERKPLVWRQDMGNIHRHLNPSVGAAQVTAELKHVARKIFEAADRGGSGRCSKPRSWMKRGWRDGNCDLHSPGRPPRPIDVALLISVFVVAACGLLYELRRGRWRRMCWAIRCCSSLPSLHLPVCHGRGVVAVAVL